LGENRQLLGEIGSYKDGQALKLRGFLGGAPHSEATEAITFYLSAQNGKVVVLTGHANRETYGGD
jgi:hypothetical protein